MKESIKEKKFSSIMIPEGLQFNGIPKMLAYKESGFSYVQITFIVYLLSQPATSDGKPWLYKDEDVLRDTGISLKSIGRFKNSEEKESLCPLIKFTPAGIGKYKTGGFYADFSNLWNHLLKVASIIENKKTRAKRAQTSSTDSQTPSPETETPSQDLWTESRTSYTTSYTTSNTTSYEEEDLESEILKQNESEKEKNDHKNLVTPGAIDEEWDELDAQLAAAGITCCAPSGKDQTIEQRIIRYFLIRFPGAQGRDYSPAFMKAKIPSEKLKLFWKYKENWNTYPALKGTDRSLYMLIKYIDDFVKKNKQAEYKRKEQDRNDNQFQEQFDNKMKMMREYNVWLPYGEGFDFEWIKMKEEVRNKGDSVPRWIIAWIGNPTNLSEEQIVSGKYTKESILKIISESVSLAQKASEIVPDAEFERTLMESLKE